MPTFKFTTGDEFYHGTKFTQEFGNAKNNFKNENAHCRIPHYGLEPDCSGRAFLREHTPIEWIFAYGELMEYVKNIPIFHLNGLNIVDSLTLRLDRKLGKIVNNNYGVTCSESDSLRRIKFLITRPVEKIYDFVPWMPIRRGSWLLWDDRVKEDFWRTQYNKYSNLLFEELDIDLRRYNRWNPVEVTRIISVGTIIWN
jgi:hypothetical protein